MKHLIGNWAEAVNAAAFVVMMVSWLVESICRDHTIAAAIASPLAVGALLVVGLYFYLLLGGSRL